MSTLDKTKAIQKIISGNHKKHPLLQTICPLHALEMALTGPPSDELLLRALLRDGAQTISVLGHRNGLDGTLEKSRI